MGGSDSQSHYQTSSKIGSLSGESHMYMACTGLCHNTSERAPVSPILANKQALGELEIHSESLYFK